MIIRAKLDEGIIYTADAINEGGGAGTAIGGIPAINISYGDTRTDTAMTVLGEMFHWAGMVGRFDAPYVGPHEAGPRLLGNFTNYYTDGAIATAANNLGFVMTVDEYRRTYPEISARDMKRWGSDFAPSTLAHGGISNACLRGKNRLLPQHAKP